MNKTLLAVVMGGMCLALSLSTFARSGKEIYEQHCAVCHLSGVAQAPKVHNVKAWQARWKKAEAKVKSADPSLSGDKLKEATMNALIAIVKKGLNAMPPGGMCPKCSDEEYKHAIEFMMKAK